MKKLAIFFSVMLGLGFVLFIGAGISLGGTPEAIASAFYESNKYALVEESCLSAGVSKIRFDLSNRSIALAASDDDSFHLSYYTSLNESFKYAADNGELCLKQPIPFLFVDFSWMYALVNPEINIVNLSVPLSFDGSIELVSLNGKVTVEGISASSLNVNTSNGELIVRDSVFSGISVLKTSNGSITAKHCVFGGASLKTSNGKILVKDTAFNDDASLKSSNGGIVTERVTPKNLTADTSNGSIKLGLTGAAADYKLDFHTSNGRCKINGSHHSDGSHGSGSKIITATTSNGNIDIDIPG